LHSLGVGECRCKCAVVAAESDWQAESSYLKRAPAAAVGPAFVRLESGPWNGDRLIRFEPDAMVTEFPDSVFRYGRKRIPRAISVPPRAKLDPLQRVGAPDARHCCRAGGRRTYLAPIDSHCGSNCAQAVAVTKRRTANAAKPVRVRIHAFRQSQCRVRCNDFSLIGSLGKAVVSRAFASFVPTPRRLPTMGEFG
jgi:hypothetical protein